MVSHCGSNDRDLHSEVVEPTSSNQTIPKTIFYDCNIVSSNSSVLPIINVTIGQVVLQALVDSGSSTNIVDFNYLKNSKLLNVKSPIVIKNLWVVKLW